MSRFFFPELVPHAAVSLSGPEAHHLAHVLRMPVGEQVQLFNGLGDRTDAIVTRIAKKSVELTTGDLVSSPAPAPRITLAVAPPKGDRFDWIIEKGVELGVSTIVPLQTQRSVVVPGDSKLDRLRQLIVSACKQSRRDHLLELRETVPWNSFLAETTGEMAPVWIAEPTGSPWDVSFVRQLTACTIIIGPEGGLTSDEVTDATKAGAIPIALGPYILRIETAAIAMISAVRLAALSQQPAPEQGGSPRPHE